MIKKFSPKKFEGKKFNSNAAVEKLYKSDDWQSYSRKFLEINDRCYACGARSQVTDHIKAHKGSVELFWKVDNYLPLCFKCHNTITAKFDREKVQKYEAKLRWIAWMRSTNDIGIKVKVVPIPTRRAAEA